MLEYADMSTRPQRRCVPGIWALILTLSLFILTLTGVALLEASEAQSRDAEQSGIANLFLVSRIWTTKNKTDEQVVATVQRIARDATNATQSHNNNYYEEQRAVVVKAENMQPIMGQRQEVYGPPEGRMDSDESYPFYDAPDDYEGPQQLSGEQQQSGEEEQSVGEGRASQTQPYDSYYGQWKYETKTPAPAPVAATSYNNRKLQPSGNRPPYDAYDDVYDYPMGFQPRPHTQVAAASKQAVASQSSALAPAPVATESSLVTFLKTLKQLWDLYQALTKAWGSVAERHQQSSEQLKKERLEKQRLRQQQQQQQKLRANAKKPGDKPGQNKKTKSTSTTTTRTTTSTTMASAESEEATPAPSKAGSDSETAKVVKTDDASENTVRGLRQKRDSESETGSSDVGEGRYIKGDPLKGYYDFVITEGSYKFWAAFQVGTAILIIYSTFAAIYYSKVNPLTSDYDYQDYLGAGRSLSGGDDDFVDDGDAATSSSSSGTSATSRIMDWLPRTSHSLQFILDAIDKLPIDHSQSSETGWSTGNVDEDKRESR